MINLNSINSNVTDLNSVSKLKHINKKESIKKHSNSGIRYDSIRIQAEKALSRLDPNKEYTAQEICGEFFWYEILCFPEKRRQAGKCFAQMVDQGDLPLCFAGKTSSNHSLYKLK